MRITILIYTITCELKLILLTGEIFVDKFGDYHGVACVEVFLESLHEVAVGVQVHVLSL